MQFFEIELAGKKLRVPAQKVKGLLWFHFNGRTYSVESAKPMGHSASGRNASVAHAGEIRAPMPGRVTKIHFQEGDRVEVNQVVVVMEAMKMEYSLKAAGSGIIKKINCQSEEQVRVGQVLVEITTEEING